MQKTWNQYHLTAELAKKYSHSTYLASPIDQSERQVVLTIYTSSLFHFPYEYENLLQKVQSIKKLQHPHLMLILDMGIEDGQPFVVCEYLPNGSLRNYLKKISPDRLELRDALAIVSQVGHALVYAHEHQIVHGNVKPENIFLDAKGQPVLAGFSVVGKKDAIIRDQISEEYAFSYLAPEQFAGVCDARSDQYALGCLAYELITGRVPFASQSLASMMERPTYTLPARLSESVSGLSPSLEVAVLKTLANDPDERFFDFSLFLDVIQSVLSPPPAFPLLLSRYSPKDRAISHPMPSAKVESLRKRVKPIVRELPKPSGSPSRVEGDLAEPTGVHFIADASVPEQTETISSIESLPSAQLSQLFTFSLSQDGHPLSNRENDSFSHPLKSQKDEELSAFTFKVMSLSEDLTTELAMVRPSTNEELDEILLADPFVQEEADASSVIAAASSVHEQSESEPSKISSLLIIDSGASKPWLLQTRRSRRGLVWLMLVLSLSFALVAYAFWPFGMDQFGGHSYIADTGTNKMVNPSFLQIPSQRTDATAVPTITLKPDLNTVASSNSPRVIASSKSNVVDPIPSSASNPSSSSASNPSYNSPSNPSSSSASNPSNSNPVNASSPPTPTPAAANSDPYPPSGTLVLNDPLSDNSRGYGWQETSSPSSNGGWACQFIGSAYHAIETQQNGFDSCHASSQASNFTLEVQMQIISGTCGGLILRDTLSVAHAYSFQVCQDRSYQLYRFDGFSSGQTLQSGSSSAITAGLNQSNVIAAVVNGSTFNLYVNYQEIASVDDGSYTQGEFGFSANGNSEAAYTNARMWTL